MVANVKISISSLFTGKIKMISSHVSRYDFSAVGEILVVSQQSNIYGPYQDNLLGVI